MVAGSEKPGLPVPGRVGRPKHSSIQVVGPWSPDRWTGATNDARHLGPCASIPPVSSRSDLGKRKVGQGIECELNGLAPAIGNRPVVGVAVVDPE